ncbi:hypothetical protein [Variovorax sp. HJSM1_2]|uniref:hypothetical protein n=1 Tax=Variovorax sp. HJSM1_2 TaxID=3366263 RepID=UPI003BCFDF1E
MPFFESQTPAAKEQPHQVKTAGRKLSDSVLQSAEQAVVDAGVQARAGCGMAESTARCARQYVVERPLSAIMVATAAGALAVGALWALRSQP